MGRILFANAPVSWGANEFGCVDGMTAEQMLGELRDCGYAGTELGEYDFFAHKGSG